MKDVMRYPGLAEWGRVTSYRQTQLDKAKNVEVHLNTELSADDIMNYGADEVILAVGSTWNEDGDSYNTMDPIPGVDASKAQFVTPDQVMEGKEVGERVVVLDADGYFYGVGMAEHLADQGKDVTVLTCHAEVAPMTHYTLEYFNLHRMMHEKGIKHLTTHWVEEVEVGNSLKVKSFPAYP